MKKYLSNLFIRIAFIIILILFFDFLLDLTVGPLDNFIAKIFNIEFGFKGILKKILMIIFSVTVMILIPGYNFKDFGFRAPKKLNYFKIIWLTFLVTIGSIIIFSVLYQGILQSILGSTGKAPAAATGEGKSFLSIVFGIWILSSVSEEIEVRGLYQTLLKKLQNYKFLKLTLSVWLSGLIFGLLHISVYEAGNLAFTLQIMSSATALGLLAAYYREKSKSIYIPILVHMLANIYSSLLMLISQ